MPKKKFYPPNDTGTQKRRFRCLLFQRPKAYPNRPRSNKNNLIKPIRRAFPKWRRLVFCVRFEKSSGEDTAVPLDASTTVMRTPSLPEFQKLLLVP